MWSYAVFIWIDKWYYCLAMWTHYAYKLLKGDAGTRAVSILKHSDLLCYPLLTSIQKFEEEISYFAAFDFAFTWQICLPSLLQVCLWHVQGVGEVWHGDCCYTNAWIISKQIGQYLLSLLCLCQNTPFWKIIAECESYDRFGFSATTAERPLKCHSISWPKNVWTADPTILAK